MKIKTSSLIAATLLIVSNAFAQPRTFSDWFVIDADDRSGDVIAGTGTENGKELLGYRCFLSDGSCLYVLLPNTRCEDKATYPMLLNAAAGSSLVTGICYQTAQNFQLLLRPYSSIESSIAEGKGLIGFAIPMESGAFRAIRFSVQGGSAAIKEAERRANERRSSTSPPSRRSATTF